MALQVKKGTLLVPAGTGNQSIADVGFQPKALLLWTDGKTATGFSAVQRFGIGISASSSQRKTWTIVADDNRTGDLCRKRLADLAISVYSNGSGTILCEADLVSMDVSGFTLNWTTASNAVIVHYLALGGADLTNAFVSSLNSKTSTGSQSTTGVGFQPSCVIFLPTLVTDVTVLPSNAGNIECGIGFATAATARGSVTVGSSSGANPTQVASYQRTAKTLSCVNNSAVILDADLTSFDPDGFTLNYSAANATARQVPFLALKGGRYFVGSDTQRTSTGTKATTGVGFMPKGLLVAGVNNAAAAVIDTTVQKLSVGAADDTASGSVWCSDTDNVATTDANSYNNTGVVLTHATNTSTLDAEASLSSFDSDGFTFNWGTADATAREFVYLAFGSDPILVPTRATVMTSSGVSW